MGDAAELFSQIYEAMDGLKTELQAAKDRASTSYREGYEAGKAAADTPERAAERDRESTRAYDRGRLDGFNEAQRYAAKHSAAPVLASNPLDPKCASIFEAAEMLASVTAAMRKLADALGAAEKRADGYKELATHRREQAWHSDSEATTLRDQLRLLAKERDEWRAEAAGRPTAIDDLRETVSRWRERSSKP
jgi:chromosome segregation ATPase